MPTFGIHVDETEERRYVEDHWTAFGWAWKETGSRTGGYCALLLERAFSSPSGRLDVEGGQVAMFLEEVASREELLTRPIDVMLSAVDPAMRKLIERSQQPYKAWPTRGETHIRVGKRREPHLTDAALVGSLSIVSQVVQGMTLMRDALNAGKRTGVSWP
jgi:hypothetical protein